MNYLYRAWADRKPYKLKNTDWTLHGFSIAGYRTNFYIPELSLMLDAGLSANYNPKQILITHGHSDHIANLPFHLYNTTNEEKIDIYCPIKAEQYVNGYIEGMFKLTFMTDEFNNNMYNLYGLEADQSITFQKTKIIVKTYEMDHSIDSIGYGVSQVRRRLNPLYKDIPKKDLGALAKSGVDLNEEYTVGQFIYMGDTWITPLYNSEIYTYKTIIIECSFILDDDYDQALKKKHIHWKDLCPFVVDHPDNEFILMHFSPRYKQDEIVTFFKEFDYLKNVILWTQTYE